LAAPPILHCRILQVPLKTEEDWTMKIERIETAQVPPRWGLLRVVTSSGLEGFGEFTVEGQLGASEAAVREMAEGFIGQDASDIKRLVRGHYDQSFYHGGAHFMSALGGIEMALWDLHGKALGQPVYSALGRRQQQFCPGRGGRGCSRGE
jgi:galactonate dehydratase